MSQRTEHFCTLFDRNFLPAGLCLHESLEKSGASFHLWILCLDEETEERLREMRLAFVTLIPLSALETPSLRAVKAERSVAEYSWTLTPFLPAFVLDRDPAVSRVTYLDADLYFFRSPALLLRELAESGAEVLITEHAYDPEYDQAATSGRFCVQFLCFRQSAGAKEILSWWQDRCIEWCFARVEDGKFGDQKYLDHWPALFDGRVRILEARRLTLGPWNARLFFSREDADFRPVFFHFHGLRLITPEKVRLFSGYKIGRKALGAYLEYVQALRRAVIRLRRSGMATPYFPEAVGWGDRIRRLRYRLVGKTRVARLDHP